VRPSGLHWPFSQLTVSFIEYLLCTRSLVRHLILAPIFQVSIAFPTLQMNPAQRVLRLRVVKSLG
jgi:hypothetical protein